LSGSGPSRKVVHAMRSLVRPPRGLARVAPLPRETTASFVARLAARNHVSEAVLFDHVGIPRPEVTDTRSKGANVFYEVEELYFNAPARSAIAWVAGVPEEHLRRALPQWEPGLASRGATGRPRARYRLSGLPSVGGCPGCVARRTGRVGLVRQYVGVHQLVCVEHRLWLLHRHTLEGEDFPVLRVDLSRVPEVLAARRGHARLLRGDDGHGVHAFRRAVSVTQGWRRDRVGEERIWPARAERIGRGKDAELWYVLAREALVYPEAVLLAGVLNEVRWGWRRGVFHAPYAEIARRLRRPWLEDPACYPGDFTRWIRTVPRRSRGSGQRPGWGWGYRLEGRYDHVPIELTRLGYVPPHALETGRGRATRRKRP
jgi:hypothetical protein